MILGEMEYESELGLEALVTVGLGATEQSFTSKLIIFIEYFIVVHDERLE
jgi:hypothetical protein